MNSGWLHLSDNDKITIFEQTAIQTGLPVQAIEKDWWVTTVLEALFLLPFATHLSFKGGTSLSKCWHLIERFSEDIDIAIDREFLGFGGVLSKTQISDKLRRASCSFVRNEMKDMVKEQLSSMGLDNSQFSVLVNETPVSTTDPEIIEVHYKSLFALDPYIQNRVLIELSGRSMSEPIETVEIKTMVAAAYPNMSFADKGFLVRAVSSKRTFLEKAFLLHEEFHKTGALVRVERMSRHLYDLEKFMKTPIVGDALSDPFLYTSIMEHRQIFIGLKDFDYTSLKPDTIDFVPPFPIQKKWEEDYVKLQNAMIYGESLPFKDLIKRIKELNEQFKNIRWPVN